MATKNPQIKNAIAAWKKAIGNEWVRLDAIPEFETATFETNQSITAILFPKNREEVQQILKIANIYKAPVYPISKGKNWGYGSRVPVSDGCAIISLERLNSIIEYDEKLAYITVEPGVTFQQVYEFLNEKNSNLMPPSIGSTPQASLIGNAVERGIGKGINGDRFGYSCNMEVVLPSGEFVNTGFGHIDKSHSKNVYRWGVGPSLDGIFTQSNYGIVTRMTFWLNPKPGYFQIFFYTVKDNAQLEKAIDALRQLRLEGTLNSTATLSNDYRVLAMKSQFPWQQFGNNQKSLPEEYIEELRQKALKGGFWVGDDTIIAATKAQGKARAKRVMQVLGKVVDKIIIINSTNARLFGLLHKPIKKITGVNMLEILYFFHKSLYLGIPMDKQLAICYWRKKTPIPKQMDMDRDKCGVIWLSPSMPFEGRHVIKVMEIMYPIYKKYNFEPNMGLNLMSDRNIACTSAIIYDREEPGQDYLAMECYKEMVNALASGGYVSYRLGTQSMSEILTDSKEYADLLNNIKFSLDPNNILSPKHYGIEAIVAQMVDEIENIKDVAEVKELEIA